MRFTKMQGAGNDYIYVNGFREKIEKPELLAVRISDRHFGVGADGLIILAPSKVADFRMMMYNADGSEGKMCGNGIRCATLFALNYGIAKRSPVLVETAAGVKAVYRQQEDFLVEMGAAVFEKAPMPDIEAIPGAYGAVRVNVGNPHFVVFVHDLSVVDVETHGARLEHAPEFPDRCNIEFVQILDETHMKLRVWERGSGETLSCGTGTCAAASAAMRLAKVTKHVTVLNPGGTLGVMEKDGSLWLSGPAEEVFDGVWESDC